METRKFQNFRYIECNDEGSVPTNVFKQIQEAFGWGAAVHFYPTKVSTICIVSDTEISPAQMEKLKRKIRL